MVLINHLHLQQVALVAVATLALMVETTLVVMERKTWVAVVVVTTGILLVPQAATAAQALS